MKNKFIIGTIIYYLLVSEVQKFSVWFSKVQNSILLARIGWSNFRTTSGHSVYKIPGRIDIEMKYSIKSVAMPIFKKKVKNSNWREHWLVNYFLARKWRADNKELARIIFSDST